MTDTCIFECEVSNKPLYVVGPDRINSIIAASKQRNDDLYKTLERILANPSNLETKYHKSCVSTYTSTLHISRWKKKHALVESGSGSQEPPKKRRSEVGHFQKRVTVVSFLSVM